MPLSASLAGVIVLMGLALYFTGNAYLEERDKTTTLKFAALETKMTLEKKEAVEAAVKKVKDKHDGKFAALEKESKQSNVELTKKLVSARNDALQKPVAFGDSLFRNFIYVDCLWASGRDGASVSGRNACRSLAATSNPSSEGLSVAVLTPTFLAGWSAACEDWPRVGRPSLSGEEDLAYDRADWDADYGNMDPKLCYDSLVAMTPEAALFFQNFLNNGSSYTMELLAYAIEQTEVIKQLTKPPERKPEQK